jgi:hypothetical protein
MRLVKASVIFLVTAIQPALSSEAFIAQVTSKAIATEQSAIAASKAVLASAMLALPLKPGTNGVSASATTAAANASSVTQSGTGNFAMVSQVGGGNASTIVQRGSGNQAVVTQRSR